MLCEISVVYSVLLRVSHINKYSGQPICLICNGYKNTHAKAQIQSFKDINNLSRR